MGGGRNAAAGAVLNADGLEPVGPPAEGRAPDGPQETWILQGEAAARTGYSVSAIRKWRRMGLVAERKIAMGADLPRVEVKLEDVLARAALQPQRRPVGLPDGEQGPGMAIPSGSLVIGIDDLEELFERMVRAERRAEVAEAELQTLQVQTRYTLGQMAELRRQLQATSGLASGGNGAAPPPPPPPSFPSPAPFASAALAAPAPATPAAPPPRLARPAPPMAPEVSERPTVVIASTPASNGADSYPVPRTRTSTGSVPPAPTDVERLAARLRSIYARLDEYRREPTISPAQESQRQRELAEYDRALVSLCVALGMPPGPDPGPPMSVETRANLTRALARNGFDVRRAGQAAAEYRPRWAPGRPRA